ncbi:hypothetical protein K502DRAFT_342193 [Neoconidiobolus thromboides FSU 785]|nr:hypothetical protein K502DRAFT_342193 [Neoconidiobolus thromboides FSU 785]
MTEQDLKLLESLNGALKNFEELENIDNIVVKEQENLVRIESELSTTKTTTLVTLEEYTTKIQGFRHKFEEVKEEIPQLNRDAEVFNDSYLWVKEILDLESYELNLKNSISYFEHLYECLMLCDEVEKEIESTDICDVGSMDKLEAKIKGLRNNNEFKNLLFYLEFKFEVFKNSLQNNLIRQFSKVLQEMKWPGDVDLIQLSKENEILLKKFNKSFNELLRLQLKYSNELKPINDIDELVIGLLPFDLMMLPITQKFRYHFMGKLATNRLDKPEWFLEYLVDIIKQHVELFHLLSDTNFNYLQLFIKAVYLLIKYKLSIIKAEIIHSEYLNNFIKQLLEYDHIIKDEIITDYKNIQWYSISAIYLNDKGVFNIWISMEKEFVLKRLTHFIESKDAFELMNTTNNSRITVISDKVITLFEAIIERYLYLKPMSNKLRYFSNVQLELLMSFYNHLNKMVNDFDYNMNKYRPIANRVHFPITPVKKMSSVLDSIHCLLPVLSEWDSQTFFLEIWHTMYPDRLANNNKGLFDDLINSFNMLIDRCSDLLATAFYNDVVSKLDKIDIKNNLPGEFSSGNNYENNSLVIFEESTDKIKTNLAVLDEFYYNHKINVLKLVIIKLDNYLIETLFPLVDTVSFKQYVDSIIQLFSFDQFNATISFKRSYQFTKDIDTENSIEFKQLF